jgi:hypothetical protein
MSKSAMTIEDIRQLDKQGKIVDMKLLHTKVLKDIEAQFEAVGEEIPKKMKQSVGMYVAGQVVMGYLKYNTRARCL